MGKAGILFVGHILDTDHCLVPKNSIKLILHNDPSFLIMLYCAPLKKMKIDKSASDEESNNPKQIDVNFSTLYTPPIAQNFWQRKFPGYVFDWKLVWKAIHDFF